MLGCEREFRGGRSHRIGRNVRLGGAHLVEKHAHDLIAQGDRIEVADRCVQFDRFVLLQNFGQDIHRIDRRIRDELVTDRDEEKFYLLAEQRLCLLFLPRVPREERALKVVRM